MFSKVIVLAYIPISNVREFHFPPTSSLEFVVDGVLDDGYSNRCEVES
jgi:hypothetical protein